MVKFVFIFVLSIIAQGCHGGESELEDVLREELLKKLQDDGRELEIPDHKVSGGWSASPGMIPYQALVSPFQKYRRYGDTCGGSLITRRHVITAAHCLRGMEGCLVSLGSSTLAVFGPGIRSFLVEAINFVIHPDYDDKRLVNDIAIIRLPTPVTMTFTIKSVSLPTDEMAEPNYFANKTGFISGFGKTSDDPWNGGVSEKLQTAEVNITSLKRCQKIWSKYIEIKTSHVCTTSRPATTCQGDSGGPLVVNESGKDYLVGVVSFGDSRCSPSSAPSVYTNVASFLPWIRIITNLK